MTVANFFQAVSIVALSLILGACNPQDFGKLKPDFGQIKKAPTAVLNMGKRFAGVKNDDLADLAEDSPLLLKDILGGSLAARNPGSDFLASLKYALDTDPEVMLNSVRLRRN